MISSQVKNIGHALARATLGIFAVILSFSNVISPLLCSCKSFFTAEENLYLLPRYVYTIEILKLHNSVVLLTV